MKYLLPMICMLLLLSGCSNDDNTSANVESKDTLNRTVIVYMNAENNLTGTANQNLEDMCTGSKSLSGKENLIVFFDNSNTSTKPCIYRLSGGTKKIVMQYDSDFVSTDPLIMEEVFQWIVTSYPAKSYGLVLWGHADGWVINNDTLRSSLVEESSSARKKSFGVDNGNNTSSKSGYWINIPTLNEIFSTLPKFKFIFSDCCNMQSVECAYELRNRTDYYIASPAEIPDPGAPYNLVVPHFFDETDDIGKGIVDEYYNYYRDVYYHDATRSVPLSIVKTSELESLAKITASKLDSIMPKIGRYPLYMPMDNIVYYTYISGEKMMFDMFGFMHKNLTAEDFAEWKAQYDKTVVYRRNSQKWMTETSIEFNSFSVSDTTCGCMSMFVPLMIYQNNTDGYQYNETIKKLGWYYAAGWSRFGW